MMDKFSRIILFGKIVMLPLRYHLETSAERNVLFIREIFQNLQVSKMEGNWVKIEESFTYNIKQLLSELLVLYPEKPFMVFNPLRVGLIS